MVKDNEFKTQKVNKAFGNIKSEQARFVSREQWKKEKLRGYIKAKTEGKGHYEKECGKHFALKKTHR